MKMKFWGFAALSLSLLATSCAKETFESASDLDGKIFFRAALGKQTKASEFTYWTKGDKINVVGYATGATGTPAAVFNKELTFNGDATSETSNWSYTDPVDQPGYSITYYSVCLPGGTAPTLTANGVDATFDYTIPAVASQKDLIAATDETNQAGVVLEFNHLLSQVNFAIQGVQNVKVVITGLEVNDVVHEGKYSFKNNTWGALTSPTGTKGDYTYAYTTGENVSDGKNVTDGTTTVVTMGNSAGGNALMLMPQDFTASGATGSFSFSYALYDITADLDDTEDPATPLREGSTSVDLKDFTGDAWEMGKRYVYLIDFTDFLKGGKIAFTVSVNAWVDADQPDASHINQTLAIADATAASIEAAITTLNAAKAGNGNLTVFPISLPATTEEKTITLTTFAFANFAVDDQIRINVNSEDITLELDEDLQTLLGEDWELIAPTAGTVYILTRKAEVID